MRLTNKIVNYYILDCARILDKKSEVFKFDIEYDSLYRGRSEEVLADLAPYIIGFESAEKAFLPWLLENSMGNSWGIFVVSTHELKVIWRHLRTFLIVEDEDGKELYFRFYDPRVLRVFLPTCDSEQLKEFFGPIEKFIVESEVLNELLVFSLENGNLKVEKEILDTENHEDEIVDKEDEDNEQLSDEIV